MTLLTETLNKIEKLIEEDLDKITFDRFYSDMMEWVDIPPNEPQHKNHRVTVLDFYIHVKNNYKGAQFDKFLKVLSYIMDSAILTGDLEVETTKVDLETKTLGEPIILKPDEDGFSDEGFYFHMPSGGQAISGLTLKIKKRGAK